MHARRVCLFVCACLCAVRFPLPLMLKMEDDGASCSLATSRTDDPASPLAHPHIAPVFTGLIVLPRIALRVCTVDRHNVAVAFCCRCVFPSFATIIIPLQPVRDWMTCSSRSRCFLSFVRIRAHSCTKAELRPARSASGREALLVLRLRRVLLGSHACEAARECRMVHLKGKGGASIVPHR